VPVLLPKRYIAEPTKDLGPIRRVFGTAMATSALTFFAGLWSRDVTPTPHPEEQTSTGPYSAPNKTSLLPGLAHALGLVLPGLSILAKSVKQLSLRFHRRHPRYELLVRVETATYLLETLLADIQSSQEPEVFREDVDELARCLEGMFSTCFGVTPKVEVCVVHLQPIGSKVS
jgi:hypothetical protein